MKFLRPFLIILAIFLLDQITKFIVISNNSYITNTGAAWGILSNLNLVLIVISILALVFTYKYYGEYPILMPVLAGGIFGNLFDRIFRGHVIDFIDIRLFNYPLFNFADVFIVSSIILIIAKSIRN